MKEKNERIKTKMKLELKHGLEFNDLYDDQKLTKLDAIFCSELQKYDSALFVKFQEGRNQRLSDSIEISKLLIEIALFLELFIADLFQINDQINLLCAKNQRLKPIYHCNKFFIQKVVVGAQSKVWPTRDIKLTFLNDPKINSVYDISSNYSSIIDFELEFSKIFALLDEQNSENSKILLKEMQEYAEWAMCNAEGVALHEDGVLFKLHKKIDYDNLIHGIKRNGDILELDKKEIRGRVDFALNDKGLKFTESLREANYCIFCHTREKDSCSKGMKDQNSSSGFKINPLGVEISGCPLEERISEMNMLKAQGRPLAAFAIAVVDNPMIAGTGHRICNDCMKSCIYQKQEPVNIPYVETQILDEILNLPWGFEIYSLLTRWNPLNLKQYLPLIQQNKSVLVVGTGPAGFTLAHYLLNYGYNVVAIDGLKIEPLSSEISGITIRGERTNFEAIYDINAIYDDLRTRAPYGFGGVMEYGITTRWNKNYLKVLRLLLERRKNYRMYGGVRFGSNITYDDAVRLGFSHIALCLGSGNPKLLQIPNILAKGARMASDFLMSLQLSDVATQENSVANLDIRLPIIVIGAGLTAIDTATESLTYYIKQIERFYSRYQNLKDKNQYLDNLSKEEKEVAMEFITHAEMINNVKNNEDKRKILISMGGVTIIYRDKIQKSSCYRINHEEVEKAFEEGLRFMEYAEPLSVEVDEYRSVRGLNYLFNGKQEFIDAKSIFIAIGTEPNTALADEFKTLLSINGKYFTMLDNDGKILDSLPKGNKSKQQYFFLTHGATSISCFGDLHPAYSGNVVKAMASAKTGSHYIHDYIKNEPTTSNTESLIKECDELLIARVHKVIRLTPTIVEVIVQSKSASMHFEPGQFFRLQNYTYYAKQRINGAQGIQNFVMEGVALTGAKVDRENDLISLIILEMGGSSDLCQYLAEGEEVVLMGPTGTPTIIPHNENVMLVGGGLGNAVLFSIGSALRKNGCKVLYFAGYRKASDRYKTEEIENAADKIVWACDREKLDCTRNIDSSFQGNILKCIEEYGVSTNPNDELALSNINRIIVIGSDTMMSAVATSLEGNLKKYFSSNYKIIASINSPMQCMMKGVCAQCLQKHIDRDTGEEHYVYSCKEQDQDARNVDFIHLNDRLHQNAVSEKLTKLWLNNDKYD